MRVAAAVATLALSDQQAAEALAEARAELRKEGCLFVLYKVLTDDLEARNHGRHAGLAPMDLTSLARRNLTLKSQQV